MIRLTFELLTRFVDDLDGTEAEETVRFAIDGTKYEIDLNAKNAAALRKTFDKYRTAARSVRTRSVSTGSVRVGSVRAGRVGRKGAGHANGHIDTPAIRLWADSNGIPVSNRGRLSALVIEKYGAATGKS